jgi:orotate phosphoribosyltransferase
VTQRERLAALLARHAYKEGDFLLSSGSHSDFYLDAKQVTYSPDGVELVGSAVLELIRPLDAQAVGGLTMGADAIVTSVVWASLRTNNPIPGFVVRKEPKEHGLQKWIEGVSPDGLRVAIVDDVITSGKSVLKAVSAAKDAGATVVAVLGLIDRQQGGRESIERAGVEFRAVCTIADIRAAAAELTHAHA